MSVIALLDCAMRIYTNHPCRLILVELGSDLPCKESIFSSDHPFMEDGNIFAPRLTISKAFALLFQGNIKRSLSIVKKSSEEPESEESAPPASLGDLTKFDLFILIHCEYSHAHLLIRPTPHLVPSRHYLLTPYQSYTHISSAMS